MPRHLLALVALLLPTAAARAADSLEWMAAFAERAFVVHVDRVGEISPLHLNARCTVVETLKGPPADACAFHAQNYGPDPTLLDHWRRQRTRLLIFFPPRADRPDPPELLSRPGPLHLHPHIFPLDGTRPLLTIRLERLFDPDEILAATRAAAPYPPGRVLGGRTIVLPGAVKRWKEGPVVQSLRRPPYKQDPGPYILRIPVDDRAEQLARHLISCAELDAVRSGLELLHDFDSPANRALARAMLADPRFVPGPRATPGWWPGRIDFLETRFYPPRAAAADVLAAWGEPVDRMVSIESALPYRPLPSPWWWVASLAVVITPLSFRWWFRQSNPPPRSAPNRPLIWATRLSLLLALITAALWWRSHRTVDNIILPTARAEHELSSLRGRLRYVVLEDRPPMRRGVHGHQPAAAPNADWHPVHLVPNRTTARFGVSVESGLVNTDKLTLTFPYRRFSLPHWIPLALFLLPPALQFARAIRRSVAKRRRTREGRCPACGYDVRATPDRCPECGHIFSRNSARSNLV